MIDWSNISGINLLEGDNMNILPQMPDKCFSLGLIDPPYNIGLSQKGHWGSGDYKAPSTKFTPKQWDSEKPTPEYFKELFRVSKNQIIWGGNYFIDNLYPTSCFVVWDKNNNGNFADCELAWTSFKTAVRKFTYTWNGFQQGPTCQVVEKRNKPAHKPVRLYEWLLTNYAKPGDTILDTHSGSCSSAIACHNLGFSGVFIEKDHDYFLAGSERVSRHMKQLRLF